MPITYRQHQDTRDGTIYNCVLMPDGKWWSAENLQWAGAGVWPNLDPANSAMGRMYSPSEVIVPEGTRLPLYQDFVNLVNACGGQSVAGYKLLASRTNDYGFSALLAGQILGGTNPSNFGAEAAFSGNWQSAGSGYSKFSLSDWMNVAFTEYGFSTNTKTSVRFIVDVFNEPHPLKLFGVNFDGFERGMTVSIQRPIQVIDSIGGSVKLIPYGPAELDEWRVETELWVKGEWASELEAAVPPYGVPQTTDMYLPPRSGSASFPGLRPALQGSNADKYIHPQVTRFESQGRKGPIVDLFGYFMDFTLRAWADGQATNQASTPTTTLPTWLAQKFAARQIQDWSVQTATVYSGGFRPTHLRSKHGRRKDVNFNLDHLTAAQANELVAFFRGVRHNTTTITCDNGPDGQQSISVYLVGLKLHRTGLHWDGTLETVLA